MLIFFARSLQMFLSALPWPSALLRTPYLLRPSGAQKFLRATGAASRAHFEQNQPLMSFGRCSQGFIKKYVQCYSCGNPETVVKVRKENIFLKCKACGAVSDVDARHKLNTYILKNPPEDKVSKAEKKCAPRLGL